MAASNFPTTIKPPIASILLLLLLIHVSVAQAIGVCYGKIGNNLPSEPEVINLYKSNCINKMRIYWPDTSALNALRGTNIDLIVDVPNDQLQTLTNPAAAANWVRTNVVPYSSNVNFRYISVGNEVHPDSGQARYVLPAMRSIQAAISAANLKSRIKVTTAIYMALIANSYPPANGVFTDGGYMAPIVRFLAENGAPLLANVYPYFAYISTPSMDLRYAMFEVPNGAYQSLFDAQLDSIYAALEKVNGGGVRVVVSESGWPSRGANAAATVENAGRYYRNLAARVKNGRGTPKRPQLGEIETYLFAMFDENMKTGDEVERHFGLFSPNKQPKYQISFC